MLLGTFITVYSGKHLKLTDILIGRNVELRNIKPSGIQAYIVITVPIKGYKNWTEDELNRNIYIVLQACHVS